MGDDLDEKNQSDQGRTVKAVAILDIQSADLRKTIYYK